MLPISWNRPNYLFLCTLTMPLIYRSKWTFANETYCRSVCGLAFSPDGLYLAYGSGDSLCILDMSTKKLMIVIRGRGTSKGASRVTSLTWLPNESFHLVGTFQDGVIATITRSSVRQDSASGFITLLLLSFYRIGVISLLLDSIP